MARKITPAPDMDLLDRLMREHGYTVDSLKGRACYATLIKRSDGKKSSMVAVRLLMPISSPYGKAAAAMYRKRERAAARTKARAK